MRELLSPLQMAACDAFTIARGTPGTVLMERAGAAVAQGVEKLASDARRILVLAGPGNNGGDGYVAARLLAERGYTVSVAALGDSQRLQGDARSAFNAWNGAVSKASEVAVADIAGHDIVVDALFGSGLTRGLDGDAAALVTRVNAAGCPVVAVDLPSGLDGATGQALGVVIEAAASVTFHRLKPGHVLFPGRALCGAITVADIGIDRDAINEAGFSAQLTGPYLASRAPCRRPDAHKYARGHALIIGGGPSKAGAAFLAASTALRAGSGLVTLAAPRSTMEGSVGLFPALMRTPCEDAKDLALLLRDARLTACALGPGLPPNENTRQRVYAAAASNAALVLDAGALTAFAGMAETLFSVLRDRPGPTVLTPHAGEFRRLYGNDLSGSKLDQGRSAAAASGAILVLKGADTVIAHPNGAADCTYVNANAPPWLATAGSGDVLTGLLAGLMAATVATDHTPEAFTALAAFGVWLHGEAAMHAGPSLVASDLEPALRSVLDGLETPSFRPLQG